MRYSDLQTALGILGVSERATLQQIKRRYRELVKQHHPDHAAGNDPAEMHRINAAYQILSESCRNYRYDFSEREFLEQTPEERMRRQFVWDPVWGGEEGEG